jgi:hippurate hydrolase
MERRVTVFALACLLVATGAAAQVKTAAPGTDQVAAIYPEVEALYLDLHKHPELSMHEEQTAGKLAERLKALGYEVTTGVGMTGIVAVMKNGDGPAVLLRTDMDALPLEEKTGLPYASKVTTKSDSGATIPVMHACGHDIHMSSWYGTAKLMAADRQHWHGTLILIGQPAEETGQGATAMLKDGLYTRFPKPAYALAIHDEPQLPAGQVGYTPGYTMASSDTVDITIYGRGGHGAQPQDTVDPIVIGARTVLALQTIVSREMNPRDPAVITVGVFSGGTKENIIPDSVNLKLTVRSYKPDVRTHLLASIERIAKGEAMAGGSPKEPLIKVTPAANATYNDPELTKREVGAIKKTLGDANVVELPPKMVFEDFSEYSLAGVPAALFYVGAVEPAKFSAAKQLGTQLPGLHSPLWAPEREPTIKTAIRAETAMLMELMGK